MVHRDPDELGLTAVAMRRDLDRLVGGAIMVGSVALLLTNRDGHGGHVGGSR